MKRVMLVVSGMPPVKMKKTKKSKKYANAEMLHVKVHVGVDTCTVYVLFMIVLLICGVLILLLLICCRCFT